MDLVWEKLDSKFIAYDGEWESVKTIVRASVFAVMLDLARDRVKYYKSDLFHDAVWLNETLIGPMQFDWIVREFGTSIGQTATTLDLNYWSDSIKYRFEILVEDKAKWTLNIYEASPLNKETIQPNDSNIGEMYVGLPLIKKIDGAEPVTLFTTGNIAHEVHAALPIRQCVMAATAAGCIYHPAPPINTLHSYTDEEKIAIAEATFPTLRNGEDLSNEGSNEGTSKVPINGKVNIMESILRELRQKLDEANSARDEAYDAKSELDEAISEFDDYIDQVDNLIASLDDMPSISVDVDVSVSFESDN